MERRIIEDWPGKSPAANGIAHPAVYHMLDVGAIAEVLLQRTDHPKPLRDAFALLAAIHDLGKIGLAFRDMLRNAKRQSAGLHWEVTEAYLRQFDAEFLGKRLGGSQLQRFAIYAAVAGHHGRPPTKELHYGRSGASPGGDWKAMLDAAGETAMSDARTVVQAFLELWPAASLEGVTKSDAIRFSWWLAGLTTASDWIASNTDWFRPRQAGLDYRAHFEASRCLAPRAVEWAGLQTPPASPQQLFDHALRPMQLACSDADLPDGPTLAIIEDEAGSGKTEAALILCQRMLLAGKGRGLYFALPTMATADAMFARVAPALQRLYIEAPSLVLAHGRASLSNEFKALQDGRAYNADEPGPTEWLADDRRRALMADVGVGTIDQALLSIVRAKHAALRLYGLSSKILIVDEVHEMGDPYMGELLAALLKAHAALGGSAILLTATLPLALRSKLSAAFESGAGRPSVADTSHAYPALKIGSRAAESVTAAPSARGPIEVRRLISAEAAVDLLADKVMTGAACVWVRNSVDEAIDAVERLRARGLDADLLHARFALCDRKIHEARALSLFGKSRETRPGRILIATQIVENSLDLDFDVMVSDLAPMAALIQRAGRLWRHMALRPQAARPVRAPVLHVLSPDPRNVESEHWLNDTLGRGAFVYPIALQWQTAKVLFEAGEIGGPGHLRSLIEAVHVDNPSMPEVLQKQQLKAIGQDGAARSHAFHNAVEWSAGYRHGARGAEDADYPTRLGQPQRALVLARWVGASLQPWSGGDWTVAACQLSEVQASAKRLEAVALPDPSAREIKAAFERLPDWLSKTRVICPVAEDGKICGQLSYSSQAGLVFL